MAKVAAKRTKQIQALQKTDFLTTEARRFFHEFVAIFISLPFLIHFDTERQIKLEADASGFAFSTILSQNKTHNRKLWPITYRK